jgi:hypothetical protein
LPPVQMKMRLTARQGRLSKGPCHNGFPFVWEMHSLIPRIDYRSVRDTA